MSGSTDESGHTGGIAATALPAWGHSALAIACIASLAALFIALARQATPLPDFSEMDTVERKDAFFEYLSPIVQKLNDTAREERAVLQKLIAKRGAGEEFSWLERRELDALIQRYEIAPESDTSEQPDIDETLSILDRRIGVIPESLVLIQAAKESGWGTSRFAVEGNNLFGQRCFEDGCGIAPLGRANPSFGVAQFDSIEQSIESYALNLNTHPRYRSFRTLRENLRDASESLKGLDLAQGLTGYSERGQAYVDEIREMILQNDLE